MRSGLLPSPAFQRRSSGISCIGSGCARALRMFQPCLRAVAMTARRMAKSRTPCSERKRPGIQQQGRLRSAKGDRGDGVRDSQGGDGLPALSPARPASGRRRVDPGEPGVEPEADACPGSKYITRTEVVFDEFGHPNGPQNGSSRDNHPLGRRGTANGRGVTTMPKSEKFSCQGEYVSIATPIPTGS